MCRKNQQARPPGSTPRGASAQGRRSELGYCWLGRRPLAPGSKGKAGHPCTHDVLSKCIHKPHSSAQTRLYCINRQAPELRGRTPQKLILAQVHDCREFPSALLHVVFILGPKLKELLLPGHPWSHSPEQGVLAEPHRGLQGWEGHCHFCAHLLAKASDMARLAVSG